MSNQNRMTLTLVLTLFSWMASDPLYGGEGYQAKKPSSANASNPPIGAPKAASIEPPPELMPLPLVVKELPMISSGVTVEKFNRLITQGLTNEGKPARQLGWKKAGNKYVVGYVVKQFEIRAELLPFSDGGDKYVILGSGSVKDTTTGESEPANGIQIYQLIVESLNYPEDVKTSPNTYSEDAAGTNQSSSAQKGGASEESITSRIRRCKEDGGVWHPWENGDGVCVHEVIRKTPEI